VFSEWKLYPRLGFSSRLFQMVFDFCSCFLECGGHFKHPGWMVRSLTPVSVTNNRARLWIDAWHFRIDIKEKPVPFSTTPCWEIWQYSYLLLMLHVKDHLGSGSVTQVVKHLPTKCETLSSNPSTTQKKDNFFPSYCTDFMNDFLFLIVCIFTMWIFADILTIQYMPRYMC
jgi:hypothetical protein